MPDSFGAGMRERRERLQISLTTIAEQTKIKLSLLEALERDDVSRWPSGIFRRAFIRAYAHAIGLDPDVVVREFLERYPDPVEGVDPVAALADVEGATVSDGPPTRFRYLVGAAVGALSQLRHGTSQRRPSAVEPLEPDDNSPVKELAQSEPDLLASAELCTAFGRVDEMRAAAPLLEQAVRILDAVGLILWVWDARTTELTPALAYGYSDKVLAQLPKVRCDDDNATAAAFRSARPSVVSGSPLVNGAVVVPLMTRGGCVGVLAIEVKHDGGHRESVRALATIFAAQLARLVELARPAAGDDQADVIGADSEIALSVREAADPQGARRPAGATDEVERAIGVRSNAGSNSGE